MNIVQRFNELEKRIKTLFARTNESYKVYSALLSQNGTDAPVATVLENTLGNVIWTRASQGLYLGTLADAFPVARTAIFTTTTSGVLTEASNNETGEPSSEIFIRTSGGDDALYLTPVEIRVYEDTVRSYFQTRISTAPASIPATAYASNADAVTALGLGVLYKSTTLINGSPIILLTV